MWSAFADMAGVELREVGSMLVEIVTDSRLGPAYVLAMAALVLAALVRVLRRSAALAWALLCVFALSRAQVSHAGGSLPGTGMLIDALHLLVTAIWLGCVFVAAWLVMPASRKASPLAYMQRLSRTAALALAAILATGLYAAWHRLGAPQRLFDHPYGLVLAAKLVLVGVAASLGAGNRFIGCAANRIGVLAGGPGHSVRAGAATAAALARIFHEAADLTAKCADHARVVLIDGFLMSFLALGLIPDATPPNPVAL